MDSDDELLLSSLEIAEELARAQARLAAYMSEGYFNLARARYRTRGSAISSRDYWPKILPLTTVALPPADGSSDMQLLHKEPQQFTKDAGEAESKRSDAVLSKSDRSSLRRRRGAGSKAESTSMRVEAGEEDDEAGDDSVAGKLNPLLMFGVLPSSELKQAQASFVAAVEEVAKLASLKVKLEKRLADVVE